MESDTLVPDGIGVALSLHPSDDDFSGDEMDTEKPVGQNRSVNDQDCNATGSVEVSKKRNRRPSGPRITNETLSSQEVSNFVESDTLVPDGIGVALSLDPSDDDFSGDEMDTEKPVGQNRSVNDQDCEEDSIAAKRIRLESELRKDPQLKELFDIMVDEEAEKKLENVRPSVRRTNKGNNNRANGNSIYAGVINTGQTQYKGTIQDEPINVHRHVPVMKSPSESTIYVPAFRKVNNVTETDKVITQISNFVEGMQVGDSRDGSVTPSRRRSVTPARDRLVTPVPVHTPVRLPILMTPNRRGLSEDITPMTSSARQPRILDREGHSDETCN